MKKQIILGVAIHNNKELEVYIPQIDIGNGWKNILAPGCYILKESQGGFDICQKCSGEGKNCKDCQGRGTTKGASVDLKNIAEILLEKKVNEIRQAQKTLLNL
jgi:hypothetical protein